jgi:hypothetical protein
MKTRATRAALTLLAVAVSALPFVVLLQLAVDVVKVYGGMAAFAALASLIPLAIGEIALVVGGDGLLERAQERGHLVRSFTRLCSVELLLLPVIEALRFLLYLPVTGGSLAFHRAFLRPAHQVLALAGLAIGGPALVASVLAGRGRRQPRSERGRTSWRNGG